VSLEEGLKVGGRRIKALKFAEDHEGNESEKPDDRR